LKNVERGKLGVYVQIEIDEKQFYERLTIRIHSNYLQLHITHKERRSKRRIKMQKNFTTSNMKVNIFKLDC
jgi:hypothetical protein